MRDETGELCLDKAKEAGDGDGVGVRDESVSNLVQPRVVETMKVRGPVFWT